MSSQETSPDETAAVLIEPILGEGGYIVPPPGFMEGVRSFCDRHNILLIADEVQSGEPPRIFFLASKIHSITIVSSSIVFVNNNKT